MNLRTLLALLALPLVAALLLLWAEREHAVPTPARSDEIALAECVRAGTLPSWDPWRGAGLPLAAGARVGAWYPPRALAYVLGPERAAPWEALLALALAGVGAQLLLGRRIRAWGVQAVLLVLGLFYEPLQLEALVWLPWSLWALEGLARGRPASGPCLAAALALAILSGCELAAGCVLLLTLVHAFARAWGRGRFLLRALTWGIAGLALSAVQWLPQWELRRAAVPAAEFGEPRGPAPSPQILAAVRQAAGDGRVARVERDEERIVELRPDARFAPRTLVELLQRIDPAQRSGGGELRLSHAALLNHPVLDRLRVTCVLSREPVEHTCLRPVLDTPELHVYARTGALPIARVVPAELVRVAGDAAVLGVLSAGGLDPRRVAVSNSEEPVPDATTRAPFEPGEILVRRPAWDRLDAEVRGSSGGWLVFQEQYDAGWKAVVNGQDEPLVRVDHALRAVRIPPGAARVRTKYEPDSIRIGAAITLLALLGCAAVAWRERSR